MKTNMKPLCIALAVALAGCAVTEPKTRVQIDMPQQFSEAAVPPAAGVTSQLTTDWWTNFGSPQLTSLIEQALAGSSDVRIAAERITQAELALRVANASLLPSIGLGAGQSFSRTDSSGTDATTRRGTSVSIAMSYEIDLWGRLAAGIQAQQEAVNISRFDADTVRLTLTTRRRCDLLSIARNARATRHRAREPRHCRARFEGRRRALSQRRRDTARSFAADHRGAQPAHGVDSARSHRAPDGLSARAADRPRTARLRRRCRKL